jgi:hypothetical protein
LNATKSKSKEKVISDTNMKEDIKVTRNQKKRDKKKNKKLKEKEEVAG